MDEGRDEGDADGSDEVDAPSSAAAQAAGAATSGAGGAGAGSTDDAAHDDGTPYTVAVMPDGSYAAAVESKPRAHELEGFFVNDDGFYGRAAGEAEYFEVKLEAEQCDGTELKWLVAVKIRGDAHVPRGHVSWKTKPTPAAMTLVSVGGDGSPAAMRIRADVNDPDGFTWMPDGSAQVVAESADVIRVDFSWHGHAASGCFRRVPEAVARHVAATLPDLE